MKASAYAEDETVFTLKQAVEVMKERNPALAGKLLTAEKADAQLQSVRGEYFPRVDFVQSWNHSNNPVYVFGSLLNQERFSEANFAIDELNNPEGLTDIASRFQLSWLLFDFGKRENRAASARSSGEIASLQAQSELNRLLHEVVRRYFAVSLALNRIEAAEDAFRSAESRRKQASDRVSEGLAVQTDQLTAEVYLAQTKQEKIDAENAYKVSVAALEEILGNEVLKPLQTESLTEKDFQIEDLNLWIKRMKENKAELKVTASQQKLANLQVKTAKAGFFPSLQAWSAYEWHGNTHSYTGENWGAGVELKWNVFRGFSDSEDLSAANLEARTAAERQKELENALLLQLQSSYFNFSGALEKRNVSSAALKQAAENRRIFADRYSEGLATIQDSLQADSDYSQARLRHLQNLYDVYESYSRLLMAAGVSEQVWQFSETNESSAKAEEGAK
jgi:outer membrane protein TolC